MYRIAALLLALVAPVLIAGTAHAADAPARVLIVGDSVTQGRDGDYSWRYFAWQQLAAGPAVDFVGPHRGTHLDGDTYGGGYADPNFDQDHAARWGQAMWQPLEQPDADSPAIGDLVAAYDPDVVVEALGVNDLAWAQMSAARMSDQVRAWVRQAQAAKPDVDVILGGVPQVWIGDAPAYNAGLPALAAELTTSTSRVTAAAVPAFVEGEDTRDFAHPTRQGEEKLGRVYADAIGALVAQPVVDPSPTPSAPVTTAPAPVPVTSAPTPAASQPASTLARPKAPRSLRAVRHGARVAVSWRPAMGAESYAVRCGRTTKTVTKTRVVLRADAASCKVRSTNDAGASSWQKVRVRA